MKKIRITMESGLVVDVDTKYIVTAVTKNDDVKKVKLLKERKK